MSYILDDKFNVLHEGKLVPVLLHVWYTLRVLSNESISERKNNRTSSYFKWQRTDPDWSFKVFCDKLTFEQKVNRESGSVIQLHVNGVRKISYRFLAFPRTFLLLNSFCISPHRDIHCSYVCSRDFYPTYVGLTLKCTPCGVHSDQVVRFIGQTTSNDCDVAAYFIIWKLKLSSHSSF